MRAKKALIHRMAVLVAIVLAAGLAGVVLTLYAGEKRLEDQAAAARQERAAAVEDARRHLEELSQKITATPVDPAIVAEAEAAYFSGTRERRRFVWGTDTEGEFLFGIPREAFARLNQLWDDHRDVLQGEGGFVDRQDFLRQLVQDSDDLRLPFEDDESLEPREARERLRRRYSEPGDWTTLSAPLRTAEGAALGSLYLRLETPEPHIHRGSLEGVLAACASTSALAFAFLWFLLPTWVFVDARERGMPRAALWSFLVLISLVLGLVVYLIARPEQAGALHCPACGREVNGGAFCPHCGHDVSRAFCSACRYPLKPDWSFCPSCRTEVGTGGEAAAGSLASEGG